MSPSNCMYGTPHAGQHVAVRSKVGRTVGWLCALHFKNHEKALLTNGYHFRTHEELQARGEDDGSATAAGTGAKNVVLQPEPQQQQPGDDHSSWDQEEAELAYERPAHRDAGGRSHGSETSRPAESAGNAAGGRQIQKAQEIMETRSAGAGAESGGLQNRTPATRDAGELGWPAWTEGAGYLTLTEAQRAILQSPFADQDITIRYDGIVYAPWRKYWSRMVKAFHPYVPSIIPIDNPRFQGQEIIVGVVMSVEGKFIGKAWGSHRLEGQNDRMAVGDRIESAISDAVSKIGKRLDMGEQLWNDQFRDYWKSQYAESYQSRGRTYWKRKPVTAIEEHEDDLPNSWETGD